MISVGRDRQIGYFRIDQGLYKLVSIFEAHEKQIFSVGINPKGTLCVSGGRDKKLNFWSIEKNGLKLLTSIVTIEFISAIEFINDENLSIGLGNGVFQVFKIETQSESIQAKLILNQQLFGQKINKIKKRPNHQNQLALCSDDGTIQIITIN